VVFKETGNIKVLHCLKSFGSHWFMRLSNPWETEGFYSYIWQLLLFSVSTALRCIHQCFADSKQDLDL